jgi:hypothetical protein
MSWLVALVGLTLTAAPPEQAVVLVGRRTAVSAPQAKVLANDASSILESAGVPIAMAPDKALQQLTRVSVKDTSSCNGKRACLAELGRQLKVPWVVLLSVAVIDQELSVGLELLKVADETVVETDSLLLPKKGKLDAALLSGFAGRVKAKLVPAPAPVAEATPDVPVQPKLVPKETEPPPSLPPEVPPPAARSHTASFVLGGVGLASLIAGGVLLAVGASSRAPLTAGDPGMDGRVRSTLTYAEAEQINNSSTPLIVGGISALAVGAGLGTAAVITW